MKLCILCKQYLNFWKINLQEKFSSNRLWERTCQHAMYFIGWKLRHFTNEGPAISPSDNVKASILSHFRMTFANCCNKVSPFQSIQFFSTFPSPSPAFLLYTNVPRTSIPKRTFFNFMIEKLPFFFDFDRNKVTSLMFAGFPIILLTSSPFQKYVPGIIEACVLAFYDKINK